MSALYFTNRQHLDSLDRLKEIVRTTKLSFYDDTTPGDKNMECTWGLCSESIDLWPTADLHLWPKDFPSRIAPKYHKPHQVCPNDYDPKNENGCFFHCKFFQNKAQGWGRQEVLTKIDELIVEFRRKYKV